MDRSRRRLLETGGLAARVGALLAACGDTSGDEAPGRVGYAPPSVPLPQPEINDVVYLRTATSIEYLMLDLYAWMIDGQLAEADQELVDQLAADQPGGCRGDRRPDHPGGRRAVRVRQRLVSQRVVPPTKAAIVGDEADLPESDDPGTDMMRMSYGFETMVSSMYQKMIEQVTDRALRVDLAQLGTLAGRHSGAVAIAVTGAPDGYVSPVVLGGELRRTRADVPNCSPSGPVRLPGLDGDRHWRPERIRHAGQLRTGDPRRELLRLRRPDLPVLPPRPSGRRP